MYIYKIVAMRGSCITIGEQFPCAVYLCKCDNWLDLSYTGQHPNNLHNYIDQCKTWLQTYS